MAINWGVVKGAEFLAQASHVLLGLLAVVWPRVVWNSWCASAIGTVTIYIYMLAVVWPRLEKEDVATGWKDIAYLTAGVVMGWGSIWAFRK